MEPQPPEIAPQPALPVAPPKPKNNSFLIILLSVLLLLATSLAFFFALQTQKLSKQLTQYQLATPSPAPTATPDKTANWKEYKDPVWNFSLKYPEEFFTYCDYSYTPNWNPGLRLWGPNFGCPDGHDIIYKISAIGFKQNEYKQYKDPSSSKKITVANTEATENIIKYDDSDGPLESLYESREILIPVENGVIQIMQFGLDATDRVFFDQILSTFRFLE